MSERLAWGIIGTGAIAGRFAAAVNKSQKGELTGVASRSQQKAEEFGEKFNVPNRYGSYEQMLEDEKIQAVYISTPHPMHPEWTIKCAEAGKHILCEKPIALNRAGAMAAIESARRNDVFLMEAFMYRCSPQTKKLVELLKDKTIGDVKLIQATFSFHANVPVDHRLLNNELGGGGILDVGCYAVSMSRLVAGIAMGEQVATPVEVKGFGKLHEETGADQYAVGILKFSDDLFAQVATGVQLNQDNSVRIYGTEGNIVLHSPWIPAVEEGETKIIVTRNGAQPEEVSVTADKWLYEIEADTVAENIVNRQAPYPAMTWEDTLGNMTTLDMWREAIGLVYNAEKPENMTQPIHGRPLKKRSDAKMTYGKLEGLNKKISRLVMGVDNQNYFPLASVMFDDFFELGGNCFDTAYVYGGGLMEKNLGQWVKNRNIREQVVVLDKGAHTPNCNPEDLVKQLDESLDRLGMDYVDIYMMHRDNLDIHVGKFVDVLNQQKKAGKMKVFGVSNWTVERIQQANEYAQSNGLTGITAVSNNFSLARMVQAPWGGCLASSDSKSRQWFEKTQMPLMPWSSQARGFFATADKNDRSDELLVKCWYSKDNFERLERVREMAQKKGVSPINIALAYVLNQPFPTFPLIGPRTLNEIWTTLPALDIELTPDELAWLNLE